MKQLLFLLLFPCLCVAQYTGNAGQKITLGEQTTADGLVFRGLAADTTRKPSVDTMAYILLDTNTNIIWQYKKATSNAWTRVGGSISSGVTGVLPVANGGTNTSTAFTAGSVVFAGASGTYTQKNNSLFFNSSNNSFGVGKIPSLATLDVAGSGQFTSTLSGTDANFSGSFNANSYNIAGISNSITWTTNTLRIGQGEYWKSVELWDSASIVLKTIQGGNVGIGTGSPTEKLHVDGNAKITGNVILNNNSGIDFGATSNSSGTMENELLDDYEEGYFTYTMPCSTSGSFTPRSGYLTGYYTKIGRIVNIHVRFETLGRSSPVGSIQLGNLPFTTASDPTNGFGLFIFPVFFQGFNNTGVGSTYFKVFRNDTKGVFTRQSTAGVVDDIVVADITTDIEGSLIFSYVTN